MKSKQARSGAMFFCAVLLATLLAVATGASAGRPIRPWAAQQLRAHAEALRTSVGAPVIPTWCKNYTHNNFVVPQFPKDFGRHEESQTEYWWYGGTVETNTGRKFGVELNLLLWNPTMCDGRMPFLANAQLVISDVQANRLLNRSTVQFQDPDKGVHFSSIPFEVQFDRDWHVRQQRPGAHNWDQLLAVVVPGKKHPGGSENENMGIKLQLQIRPPFNVLNGRNGFEVDDDRRTPEGEEIGSMHVSQPRIEVLPGSQLYINDSTVQLAGGSMWMQHMWLSVAMTPRENLAYWNWFHFQLSNGWNLEITYFRFEDGRPTPYPNGNLFSPTGDENYHFKLDAITFREYGPWRSPKTGIVYNIRHDITVEIPGHRIQVSTKPLIDDNEVIDPLGMPQVYYEGANEGSGTHNGQRITTRGFTEIIGLTM